MEKNAKILITGSSGMVGKTMHQLLKEKGFTNILTPSSKETNFADQSQTAKYFDTQKPEYVFHFAAKVGGIMANIENPAKFLYENLLISANVINSSKESGVTKLLNLGSSCIYPRECPQPMKEEHLLTGKLEPTNEGYALAKIAALKLCETYNFQYGTNFISLMPCNLYGTNEHFNKTNSHVLAALVMKFHEAQQNNTPSVTLWGTGVARREFLFVEDLCHAALHFMLNYNQSDLENSHINIGSGEDISIKELANIIKETTGFTGEIKWDTHKPDGMPQKLLDVSKMQSFGFTPQTSLRDGIQKTYEYYLKTL